MTVRSITCEVRNPARRAVGRRTARVAESSGTSMEMPIHSNNCERRLIGLDCLASRTRCVPLIAYNGAWLLILPRAAVAASALELRIPSVAVCLPYSNVRLRAML